MSPEGQVRFPKKKETGKTLRGQNNIEGIGKMLKLIVQVKFMWKSIPEMSEVFSW